MRKKLVDLLKKEVLFRRKEREQSNWSVVSRENQRCPSGPWKIWLILAGRGFGKTRTGAETVRAWMTQGLYRRMCLLSDSLEEGRQVMIEGESGLMTISPAHEGVFYEPSKRHLIWPNKGMAILYSAHSPQQLRGPQFDAAWIDELAKFEDPQGVWDQLNFCLRLGHFPRIIITTTPRPIPFLKKLITREDIVITRGSTFENKENLSEGYLEELSSRYMGTRLGTQEIDGHILEEAAGALWRPSIIQYEANVPEMVRILVAVDPAVTHFKSSDETGIVVVGRDAQGRGYVLEDISGRFSPTQWIQKAVEGFMRYRADRVIAEVNNGGDMVENLLHTLYPDIPYQGVRATRGKYVRAEPVAALYEQGKIFHCRPFLELELQMLTYTQGSLSSPDRLDALVWGLSCLFCCEERKPKVWSL